MLNQFSKFIITIDGPSASGKGTVAAKLAQILEIPFLPTGNIYRAFALNCLRNFADEEEILSLNSDQIQKIALEIQTFNLLENELGRDDVAALASKLASQTEVRKSLFDFQRNFIKQNPKSILEGRDCGTVICPEADLKIFLTANAEVRAQRRFRQLPGSNFEQILQDIKIRDERDSNRADSPLKPAFDAVVIDSSDKKIDEILAEIQNLIALNCIAKIT